MATIKGHPASVLIFDMNETLLDLSKVKQSVAETLKGDEKTVSLWFETMLHYSLVDTVCEQYHNFEEIGAASLMMLAENRGMELTKKQSLKALNPIKTSPPHPGVPAALEKLGRNNFRLAVLTNSSNKGMQTQLRKAGIEEFFDEKMSVEDVGYYKPHQKVYKWACKRLKVKPEDCLLIAAHGWDVAGAMAAGMKAAFIARHGQTTYPLAPKPKFVESDLKALAKKLV